MRRIALFLMTFSLISPAMAQLELINPPVNPAPAAATTGQPGARKLTPDGKIQIGYDKRSDYRLIKQPTGAPPAPAQSASASNPSIAPNSPQNSLDGDIFNAASAPQPAPSPASATAQAAPAAPAAAPKARSDSALRSDSTPAREAAAAAQAAAAAKAVEEKKKADALAAAITAAQKAGALPLKPQ